MTLETTRSSCKKGTGCFVASPVKSAALISDETPMKSASHFIVQVFEGAGSFLFKACHARAGGNPEMFC